VFVRPCWKPNSRDEIYSVIDENPWAMLISNGEQGPFQTSLPMLLDRSRDVLVSHIARGNEHATALQNETRPVLAVFQGPYTYVTGSWYPGRDMPSTYYYSLVHCYGSLTFQTNPELAESLEVLVQRMETPLPRGWKTSDIQPSDITRRLPAIMGFELKIDRLEAKFKLGQDEPRRDALAVAAELEKRDASGDAWLARMIRRYNEPRHEGA
jgi:transcriptional regulator